MAITESQKQNREGHLGGSIFPAIYDTSGFKTREQALRDYVIPKERTTSIYAILGNLVEPVVQEVFGIENTDEIEYEFEYEGVPFKCHTDGNFSELIGNETKYSSKGTKDVAWEYRSQAIAYTICAKKNDMILTHFKRTQEIKDVIKDILTRHELDYIHDLQEGSEIALKIEQECVDNIMPLITKEHVEKNTVVVPFEIKEDEKVRLLKVAKVFWEYVQKAKEDNKLLDDVYFMKNFNDNIDKALKGNKDE